MDPMDFFYLDYGNDVVDDVDRPYNSNQNDGDRRQIVRQSLNSSNFNSAVKDM
jgi:hypothetical protein